MPRDDRRDPPDQPVVVSLEASQHEQQRQRESRADGPAEQLDIDRRDVEQRVHDDVARPVPRKGIEPAPVDPPVGTEAQCVHTRSQLRVGVGHDRKAQRVPGHRLVVRQHDRTHRERGRRKRRHRAEAPAAATNEERRQPQYPGSDGTLQGSHEAHESDRYASGKRPRGSQPGGAAFHARHARGSKERTAQREGVRHEAHRDQQVPGRQCQQQSGQARTSPVVELLQQSVCEQDRQAGEQRVDQPGSPHEDAPRQHRRPARRDG